ncbi:MAG TPA: Gfo/Idh/MocA family oxidoreductase [Vicinamibacterales bacterium]
MEREGSRPSVLTRREFVSQALGAAGAIAAAPAVATAAHPIIGANDTVGVGYIGIGIRGEILMRASQATGAARIAEVCDLYDGHFERAREIVKGDLRTGRDYKRVLENRDVDAVVVAVPDHWHKPITLDAVAAGKDVYLEKPMTFRWQDGPEIAAAVRKAGRILQVGSQYESMPANARAIELIKSGALGHVTLISGNIHRNTATGAWYYPVPPDASPQTIDWERFLGPAPKREFDARRFFQWRLFWDYSGGLATDLFVHLVTAVHTLMGVHMPKRVTAMGGIYHWKDREVPDQLSAIVEYPEGFTLTLTSTANNSHTYPLLTIMGTEGTLEYHGTRLVLHRQPQLENYTYSTTSWPAATKRKFAELNDLDPASMRPRATAGQKNPPPETIEAPGTEATQAHLAKFFDSVRSRKEPVQNAEFGSRCATVAHMINISHKDGKMVQWNGEGIS